MIVHSRVELARLVDDLLRDGDLADVVQQRAELEVAQLLGVEPERVADLDRERDDALRVLAGVAVVGIDDVAEHERGAAVGVVELGEARHARCVARARRSARTPSSGSSGKDGPRAALDLGRDHEGDGVSARVDAVDPQLAELLAQAGRRRAAARDRPGAKSHSTCAATRATSSTEGLGGRPPTRRTRPPARGRTTRRRGPAAGGSPASAAATAGRRAGDHATTTAGGTSAGGSVNQQRHERQLGRDRVAAADGERHMDRERQSEHASKRRKDVDLGARDAAALPESATAAKEDGPMSESRPALAPLQPRARASAASAIRRAARPCSGSATLPDESAAARAG